MDYLETPELGKSVVIESPEFRAAYLEKAWKLCTDSITQCPNDGILGVAANLLGSTSKEVGLGNKRPGPPRLVIVGASVKNLVTAFILRMLCPYVDIKIFEKTSRVGGRAPGLTQRPDPTFKRTEITKVLEKVFPQCVRTDLQAVIDNLQDILGNPYATSDLQKTAYALADSLGEEIVLLGKAATHIASTDNELQMNIGDDEIVVADHVISSQELSWATVPEATNTLGFHVRFTSPNFDCWPGHERVFTFMHGKDTIRVTATVRQILQGPKDVPHYADTGNNTKRIVSLSLFDDCSGNGMVVQVVYRLEVMREDVMGVQKWVPMDVWPPRFTSIPLKRIASSSKTADPAERFHYMVICKILFGEGSHFAIDKNSAKVQFPFLPELKKQITPTRAMRSYDTNPSDVVVFGLYGGVNLCATLAQDLGMQLRTMYLALLGLDFGQSQAALKEYHRPGYNEWITSDDEQTRVWMFDIKRPDCLYAIESTCKVARTWGLLDVQVLQEGNNIKIATAAATKICIVNISGLFGLKDVCIAI